MKFDVVENGLAGKEPHARTTLVRRLASCHRLERNAFPVLLIVMIAVAINVQAQVFGKRIDDGHTHAMQTTGDLISAAAELTAGMQYRHDDFRGGSPFLLVHIDRNATTIVRDQHAAPLLQDHENLGAITGKCLVN